MYGIYYYLYVNGKVEGFDETSIRERVSSGIIDMEDDIIAMSMTHPPDIRPYKVKDIFKNESL